jgi:hypothetical protein
VRAPALLLAAALLAGCGDGSKEAKKPPPSPLAACADGGEPVSDPPGDVRTQRISGTLPKGAKPAKSTDLVAATVYTAAGNLCMSATTAGGAPEDLELTGGRSGSGHLFVVGLRRGGSIAVASNAHRSTIHPSGARVQRDGATTRIAVPLADIDEPSASRPFPWTLFTHQIEPDLTTAAAEFYDCAGPDC